MLWVIIFQLHWSEDSKHCSWTISYGFPHKAPHYLSEKSVQKREKTRLSACQKLSVTYINETLSKMLTNSYDVNLKCRFFDDIPPLPWINAKSQSLLINVLWKLLSNIVRDDIKSSEKNLTCRQTPSPSYLLMSSLIIIIFWALIGISHWYRMSWLSPTDTLFSQWCSSTPNIWFKNGPSSLTSL